MQIKDLKPNPKNPRRMTQTALGSLRKSLAKYGDLSGFVYNRRSKTLISGHQKQKTIPPDSTIKIEQKYDQPTSAFTVADGYVLIDGERFKYREVDADHTWESEAMIAANKHSGQWDDDLLKVLVADIPSMNLELAGFSIPEIKSFNIPAVQVEIPEQESEPEQTDEEYVRSTPETTEQIPTEGQALNANPFAEVEEKTVVDGKRFVIIIDCTSKEHKEALREKLRPLITEAGAKIF